MILRVLDLMGLHQAAEDGFDQWVSLPMEPSSAGHHEWPLPDYPNLETCTPELCLRSIRTRGHRLPLPDRSLQMESHRTPTLQRDQQELGCKTARQLRNDPQLSQVHHHLNRSRGQGLPRAKDLPERNQDLRPADG